MTNLRKLVTDKLLADGAEQVMIRPTGLIRIRQNGAWIDAGCVGDYASQFVKTADSASAMTDTGYDKLD